MSSATAACHLCARLRRSAGLRYLILGAPLACVARKRACRSAAVIALLPNGLGPRFMGAAIRYVTSVNRTVCVRDGFPKSSADLEEARVALIAAARRLGAASLCAFDLVLADEG